MKSTNLVENLDRYLAILGLVFSFSFSIYLLKKGYISRSTLIISVMISCWLWLNIRDKIREKVQRNSIPNSNYFFKIINILTCLLFAITLLSLKFRPEIYERPISFFILVSMIAGLVSLCILNSNNNQDNLNLIYIIFIGIILSWSQMLIFPGLLGVDPWWHQMFANRILETHFIPNDLIYSKLPIFHLNIVLTSLLTGFDYKLSSMASSSFMLILCNSLFIYLIAKFIFGDYRVGLLSSLLLVTANLHINGSYWLIPNSFASIYLISGIYCFLKFKKGEAVSGTIIAMIFMVCLIWTHALVSLFMSISLGIFYLGTIFYKTYLLKNIGQDQSIIIGNNVPKNKEIPINYIYTFIFFTVFMISWWAYASGQIAEIAKLVSWGYSIDNYFAGSRPEGFTENILAERNLFESLFNDLGANLFFGLSIIGIFFMISRKGNLNQFLIAFAGIAPLSLVLFSNFLGLFIYINRWLFLAELLLCIPLAAFVILIFGLLGFNNRLASFFTFLFISSLTFIMIFSPQANIDNYAFSKDTAFRNALMESELDAYKTVSGFFEVLIKTDQYYSDSQIWYYDRSKKYRFVGDFSGELYARNLSRLSEYPILIRKEIINKPVKIYGLILPKLGYDINSYLVEKKFSTIYDSESVKCYVKNVKIMSNFNEIRR